jgi:RNA 3'-terminal phosphate cyclase (ATP)
MRDAGILTLDASRGEGGGQVLRTALALAAALERPVALTGVRARRPRPGLQPQHLTVVRALAAISRASVVGDALDSTEVTFVPGRLAGGEHRFDVGATKASAGALTLLFQALLLPLSLAPAPTRLTLVGGTHVPWSPPFHYLADVFLPAAAALGVDASVALVRWGWYPAGGGEIEAEIRPVRQLRLATWTDAPAGGVAGVSAVSRLPRSIAERQQRQAVARLAGMGVPAEVAVVVDQTARTPGTLVFLAWKGRAGFSALGRRGVPAERVADEAVEACGRFRASGAALDEHLADQLVPFLALTGGPAELTCLALSSHLRTVAWVVEQFLPVRIVLDDGPPAWVRVVAGGAGATA